MVDQRRPGFADQFVLSDTETPAPWDFSSHTQDGWTLHSGPHLPVTTLVCEGRPVGWLLGWAAYPGGFVDDAPTFEIPPPLSDEFEAALYELGGRWLCILTGTVRRVYLDAGGSLSVVYRRAGGKVASTTTLLQDDPDVRPVRAAVEPNHSYAFGETSDPGAARLMPSQYLDLDRFVAVRHWPREAIVPDTDPGPHVEAIARSLTWLLEALSTRAPLVLPLTAGRDSRMLLASARAIVDRVEFVTFDYTDHRNADTIFGRAVARRFGLRHRVLCLTSPTPQARADYLHAVGYDSSDGKSRDFLSAAAAFPESRGWITGFAGEVGRARFWHEPDETITPEVRLSRLRVEPTPERIAAAEHWLESLPGRDPGFVLDMMYIDQRLGGWVSPQLYGTATFAFTAFPLGQRRIFEAMLRLPGDFRRKKLMSAAVVALGWPELSGYPYGRGPGLAGRWGQARALPFRLRNRIQFRREQARHRRSLE